MKQGECYLGIDSSCYTTSLAVCDGSGNNVFNYRKILSVKDRALGLRQSEAVFLHLRNYNELLKDVDLTSFGELGGVCVSVQPRSVEGSYMPVFCAGEMVAYASASAGGTSVCRTSHQMGHLFAAMIGNEITAERFISVHLSGGTSEILLAEKHDKDYSLDIIGGSLDIAAGQLIDRAGVRLGYSFPAGIYVEKSASACSDDVCGRYKISTNGFDFNLSGVEAQVIRDIDSGTGSTVVCRSIEDAISTTILRCVCDACNKNSVSDVLFFGGVICNRFIRNSTRASLLKSGINAFYASEELSGDNACGLAFHAYEVFRK